MKNNERKDLGYQGEGYQKLLVKCLVEDQHFFIKLYPILDQNAFTYKELRQIVAFMKERYFATESVPTYVSLKIMANSKIMDDVSRELVIALLSEIRDSKIDDILLIEEEAIEFFKQQNLIKAIRKAEDIIKKGEHYRYSEIEGFFQDALKVNRIENTSFRLFENIESDLRDDYRHTIPTGATKLDEVLYGGIGRGELGLIVCPLGVGKTSSTTGFAAHAATYKCEENNYGGYKVLHIFFEDNDVVIRRKYYGYKLNIDAEELSKPGIRDYAIAELSKDDEIRRMLTSNIKCCHLETGEVSASDIEIELRKHIASGFQPDMVILDYFECLRPEKKSDFNDSEWSREGVSMRKLERLVNKYNIAMWVPVQGTKSSIGAEYVGMLQAGGSVKKTQIGHIVITFAQTEEQKSNGVLTLRISKFRAGRVKESVFEGVEFNNGTCKFNFDSFGTTNGLENKWGTQNSADGVSPEEVIRRAKKV